MITRQRVLEEKRVARKMDYHPTRQTVHMLCDSLLELLDTVDGGQDQRDWEQERRQLDTQVGLGLLDLVEVLHNIIDNVPADLEPAVVNAVPLLQDLSKAVLIAELIDQMVGEKLRNRKQWSWYQPRIKEEFE